MPPECSANRDAFRQMVKSVFTGTLCSLLSDGMLVFLHAVRGDQCPDLVVLEADDPDEAVEKLGKARCEAHVRLSIFWVIAITYTLLSLYVTICFLANVERADALGFVGAYFTAVFEDFVLKPMIVAFFAASVCSLVLCCSQEASLKVREVMMAQTAQPLRNSNTGSGRLTEVSLYVDEISGELDGTDKTKETVATSILPQASQVLPSSEALRDESSQSKSLLEVQSEHLEGLESKLEVLTNSLREHLERLESHTLEHSPQQCTLPGQAM
eukprot:TRINITY_DN18231_c0_g1_i1.p1 TRINITY_DN18231_c0_g1~~TRINITY_DN18231_c0_g1_i1.p1  ORF type:complete len:299 (-),score=50.70 TRINITY_DN18231_c0_g1_i1:159-968(-)